MTPPEATVSTPVAVPTATISSDTCASILEELSDDEDLLSQAEQLEASQPQVFIAPGSRDTLAISESKGIAFELEISKVYGDTLIYSKKIVLGSH